MTDTHIIETDFCGRLGILKLVGQMIATQALRSGVATPTSPLTISSKHLPFTQAQSYSWDHEQGAGHKLQSTLAAESNTGMVLPIS